MQFDTMEYVLGWEYQLRLWLPAPTCLHEAEGAPPTPVCLSEAVSIGFVEHLLHARCCTYHPMSTISLNPYNNRIQIHHLHFFQLGKLRLRETMYSRSEVTELSFEPHELIPKSLLLPIHCSASWCYLLKNLTEQQKQPPWPDTALDLSNPVSLSCDGGDHTYCPTWR